MTPSELVLLRGEQFAPPGSLVDKVTLLHNGQEVSAKTLARVVFAIAILANEQAGVLRLQPGTRKGLFGLAETPVLWLEPVSASAQWPAGTLEAQIQALATKKGANDLYTIVHAALLHDYANPWASALDLVKAGLARRGLLQAQEKKQFLAASRVIYTLPPATAQLAAQQSAAPLQNWLVESERQRPALHKLLLAEIDKALKKRLEQSTSV